MLTARHWWVNCLSASSSVPPGTTNPSGLWLAGYQTGTHSTRRDLQLLMPSRPPVCLFLKQSSLIMPDIISADGLKATLSYDGLRISPSRKLSPRPHLMVSAAKHDTHISPYSFYSYCWHRGWNSFLQLDIDIKMPHDITHYLSMLYNHIRKRYWMIGSEILFDQLICTWWVAIRLLMRKTYTIPSPSETIALWVYPRLDNYMMDKATIGQEVEYPCVSQAGTIIWWTRCVNWIQCSPRAIPPHKDVFFMHKRVGIWSDNQPITDRDEWQTWGIWDKSTWYVKTSYFKKISEKRTIHLAQ